MCTQLKEVSKLLEPSTIPPEMFLDSTELKAYAESLMYSWPIMLLKVQLGWGCYPSFALGKTLGSAHFICCSWPERFQSMFKQTSWIAEFLGSQSSKSSLTYMLWASFRTAANF